MQAASIILTILLTAAVGGLWRRRSADWAVIDEHAERLSTLEQVGRNAHASITNLTGCVEELQTRQFEHGLDHAPPRKPRPVSKVGPAEVGHEVPVVVVPLKPAAKKAAPAAKAPAKRPRATKRSVR